MSQKLSGFSRRMAANIAVVIGLLVLAWIAFRIIKGFIVTLVLIAIALGALYLVLWGWPERKKR